MYDAADDNDNPIYDDNDVNDDDNPEFNVYVSGDSDNDGDYSVPVSLSCPYCGDKSPNRTTIINNHLVWVCSECFIDILKFESARRKSKTKGAAIQ